MRMLLQDDATSQDDMSPGVSEDSDPIDVSLGSQSGYMQEESPDPDAAAMEEEDPDAANDDVERGDDDGDGDRPGLADTATAARGSISPPPWRGTQSPKVARKDVNLLHHVRDPSFFAAAQQQSKVKEGEWAEVKLGESDGSGNIINID